MERIAKELNAVEPGHRSSPELAQPSPEETIEAGQAHRPDAAVDVFRISPLIRLTLFCLYLALTIPLPFLSQLAEPNLSAAALWLGISLGGVALYAVLSEQVIVSNQAIQVTYPTWVPRFFRRGWFLSWAEVKALKPRSTGQGGLVYYFLSTAGQAYLLPMRVAGFARLVNRVQAETGIDTRDVRPLSQPWMYFILLGCTLLLLAIDAWTIWAAVSQAL